MGVRMRHPDLDTEIVVAAEAAAIHRGSGWVPVEGQQDMGEELPAELQRFEGQPPVRMRHPTLDGEITVAESAVPIHRSNGWLVVDEQTEAEPEPESKPARRRRGQQQQAESPAEPASEEGEQ